MVRDGEVAVVGAVEGARSIGEAGRRSLARGGATVERGSTVEIRAAGQVHEALRRRRPDLARGGPDLGSLGPGGGEEREGVAR